MKQFTQKTALILAHGLMLFLGLYGTAFCIITGFSLPADYAALGAVCFWLTVLFTALFALPKLWQRSAGLGLLALGLGWWVWDNLDALCLGALAVVRQVGRLFITAFGLSGSLELTEYLGGLTLAEETRLATMCLFTFFALLGCALGWLIGRGHSFWVALWCTAPFLLAVLANTVTPNWTPLIMLLLFWALGLMGRYLGRSDPGGAAKLTLCAAPVVLAVLVGLKLLLPMADYEREDWTEQLRLLATDWMTLAGRDIVNAGGASSVFGVGATGEVDLSQAGPLNFSGRTVLRVEGDTTGRIYLRGFSSAVYEGSWGPLNDEAYKVLEGEPDVVEVDLEAALSSQYPPLVLRATGGIGDYQPLNFPAMADAGGPSVRVVVENTGAPSGYVYTPYQLTTTPERMTGAEFVHDAYLARGAGMWKYVLYARDRANPEHGNTLTGEAAEAELAYCRFVYENYLQVPDDVRQVVGEMMEERWEPSGLVIGDGQEVRMGEMVRDILAELAVYDPDTPLTPDGEDFVTYFLTESNRGYCMHFASAAVLMLRTLGVPARYTAGYVADVTAGEPVDVPDYNAHAWVEVYCAGYGWQPVEVTPSFDGDFPWERQTGDTAPTPTPTPSADPTPTPSALPSHTPGSGGASGGTEEEKAPDARLLWLLLPAALGAAVLGFFLRRRLAAERRARRFTDGDRNRSALAYYTYGHEVMDFCGATDTDERVETLAHKAMFSQHTLTEEEHTHIRAWAETLAHETDQMLNRGGRLRYRYWKGLY